MKGIGLVTVGSGAFRALLGLLALGSVSLGSGCDWLKASDLGRRSSPFLSNLEIDPSSVLCDESFQVSFDYDDPQGDIYLASLRLQYSDDSSVVDSEQLWPEDISKSSGTATFELTIPCGNPGGSWTLSVTAEDDLAHTSNVLTGTVTLNSAG